MSVLLQSPFAGEHLPRPPGALLDAVIEAKRRNGLLLLPSEFPAAIDGFVRSAEATDARAVYGCSEIGHAIAGAMAVQSASIRLWTPGQRAAVLLIDGVVAGLAGVERAQRHAEAVGATSVRALLSGIVVPEGQEPLPAGAVSVITVQGGTRLRAA